MPIARRIASLAFALVLVTSLFAPLAAQPASAASGEDICSSPARFVLTASTHLCQYSEIRVDSDDSVRGQQIDLYVLADSNYETWESWSTVHDNYMNDTGTIASLEAKHAIAQAWENGSSASVADSNARQAIEDYYAQRQRNLLAEFEKQNSEVAYIADVTNSHPDIDDRWIYNSHWEAWSSSGDDGQIRNQKLTGNTTNATVTLSNGETMNVTYAEVTYEVRKNSTWSWATRTTYVPVDGTRTNGYYVLPGGGGTDEVRVSGSFRVKNVEKEDGSADPNYPDTKALDYRQVTQRLNEIEDKRDTVLSNYPDGFAEDLYNKLESGEITVEEIYGAEGMARYLSGTGNATEQRFQYATMTLLNLNRSESLNQTMTIEYNASTSVSYEYNESTDTTVANYSDPVTGTVDGMLFSSDKPSGGFELNTTYNVSNLSGTQSIATDDGRTINLYNGTFTITHAYDSEGDPVETVNWQETKYDTYNADEFIKLLEQAAQDKEEINEKFKEESSLFGGLGFGGLGGGGLVGLAIIGGILLVVAGIASNRIPIVGN